MNRIQQFSQTPQFWSAPKLCAVDHTTFSWLPSRFSCIAESPDKEESPPSWLWESGNPAVSAGFPSGEGNRVSVFRGAAGSLREALRARVSGSEIRRTDGEGKWHTGICGTS